nr:unnamed protein product [Callosobruchus analis]
MAPTNKILRRKIGGRPYIPYSINAMEQCLRDVRNHVLTQREASKKYKITCSAIILKLKAYRNNNVNVPGRKCIFSPEEEKSFVDHVVTMCNC